MGQFDDIKAHLRALRDVSDVVNGDSGKVVHEVMPDGSVYFGTLDSAGNTDETSKFPSAVALIWRWTGDDAFRDDLYDFTVRNMHYVVDQLDDDGDGWPEGLGNVERAGMGVEKLDNTVYTIRGLRDLADLARSKGDTATATWASERAAAMEADVRAGLVVRRRRRPVRRLARRPGRPGERQHQDPAAALDRRDPDGRRAGAPGPGDPPLATDAHGQTALDAAAGALLHRRVRPVPHRHRPDLRAGAATPARRCDSVVSSVPERAVGLLAQHRHHGRRRGQLRPARRGRAAALHDRQRADPARPDVWEMPGAMPEIAPSPDFVANIDRPLYDRSMVLQAWGTYGTLWPVVHHQLGVSPDLGPRRGSRWCRRSRTASSRVAGSNIRLGAGPSTSRPPGPRRS